MALGDNVKEFGVPYFGMDDKRQGIVHIIGPEQVQQKSPRPHRRIAWKQRSDDRGAKNRPGEAAGGEMESQFYSTDHPSFIAAYRLLASTHCPSFSQGFTLPGTTVVCGDSHTATHGAFGSLAFGIGTSEVEHVLATQTLLQKRAKNMKVSTKAALKSPRNMENLLPT